MHLKWGVWHPQIPFPLSSASLLDNLTLWIWLHTEHGKNHYGILNLRPHNLEYCYLEWMELSIKCPTLPTARWEINVINIKDYHNTQYILGTQAKLQMSEQKEWMEKKGGGLLPELSLANTFLSQRASLYWGNPHPQGFGASPPLAPDTIWATLGLSSVDICSCASPLTWWRLLCSSFS